MNAKIIIAAMLSHNTFGKGLPLVLLHAFPLTSRMWEEQVKRLSAAFQVVVPDLPGFGKSKAQSEITMESMAYDIAELLKALNIKEPVIMAGLSMGGYVSFEFLRHFPDQLRGLGLFATRASADTPEAKENRFKSIEAMERFGFEPFAKKAVKSQLGKTTLEKNPALTEKVLKIMAESTAEAAIAGQRAMAKRHDSTGLLSGIHIPVLILAGEEDGICSPEEMRGMHEKIKGSEFHAIPQAGHLLNLEQPEAFHLLFLNFLKSFQSP